ncbi:zf-TFIIB domain-containing protein [Microbacterium sp. A196]|uniref:TFIIB-type zinc ribbon-containing protein n=1 Tax=Microbacterium sp. A196 TaxID=3457320 RepID=UPI003FD10B6C
MDDLSRQRQLRLERDALAMDVPNCPACLHQMEPAEANGEYIWECHECGATRFP